MSIKSIYIYIGVIDETGEVSIMKLDIMKKAQEYEGFYDKSRSCQEKKTCILEYAENNC